MAKRNKFRVRVEKRREEAKARQAAYDALTIEEKIAKAKSAPGNSKRQLRRLGILVDN